MARPYRQAGRAAILALCGLWALPASGDHGPLLCVLVPHFKDEYWLSVAYGIEGRAEERHLRVRFFEAGGYGARGRQIAGIGGCEALGADAILIGAVASDHPELLAAVAEVSTRQPVIGLVNELRSDRLAARVGVDWREMGRSLGRDLAARHPAGTPRQSAILLSGPSESGWVAPLEAGLREGLRGSSVEIVATYGADTGTGEQLRLLERALAETSDPDLVIGDAPAIEAAMALFAATPGPGPELVSTYISHNVARGLVGGQVSAAPYDDPIEQGALAVDAALEAIAGQTRSELVGPAIRILGHGTDPASIRLSPAGYFPRLD